MIKNTGLEFIVDTRDTSLIDELLPNELLQEHIILIDSDDELLTYYKDAAVAAAENLMNRPLFKSVIVLSANSIEFRLPYGGYQIDAMEDANGNKVQYRLNRVTKKVQITSNAVLPVQATVNCDFDGSGNNIVPSSIIHGLLLAVATAYQNRESIVLGISATEIPQNHQNIFLAYRLPNNAGGV